MLEMLESFWAVLLAFFASAFSWLGLSSGLSWLALGNTAGDLRITGWVIRWPWAWLLLLLLPLWWRLYVGLCKARLDGAMVFGAASLLAAIRKQPRGFSRLLWPVCASVCVVLLVGAVSRPALLARVPENAVDVMLVLDISLSMMAEDVAPDRITAAKQAAMAFVQSVPRSVRVGLTVFAENSYVLSPPTRDRLTLVRALSGLNRRMLEPKTAIGGAMMASLRAMEVPIQTELPPLQEWSVLPEMAPEDSTPSTLPPESSAKLPGKVMVLISDGDSREGYPWDVAAMQARQAGVPVHTVAVGTDEPTLIEYQGQWLPVTFSEATLREIARLARGRFFRVLRPQDFDSVYAQVQQQSLRYQDREIELSFVLSAVALAILLLGSLWRERYCW